MIDAEIKMERSDLAIVQIKNLGKEATDSVLAALVEGANLVRNDLIHAMKREKKTGRVYDLRGAYPGEEATGFRHWNGRWIPVVDRWKKHRSSAPGEPPASDTGETVRSLVPARMDRAAMEVEMGIVGGAPYAKYFEEEMDRPFLKWFAEWNQKRVLDLVVKAAAETFK